MALLSYEFMRRAFLAAIFIAGIAPMLGVFLVIRRQSLMADTLAILMSGGLALALVLMNLSGGNSATSIQSYLFGSIVTITQEQVWILGFLFLVVFALFFLFKRPMYILTFDEDTAHVDGLPVRVMSMLFNVLTGVAIAMMIPIAGALLISAIMVLPAAISMRLGKSFNAVILISVVIGMIGMMSGLTSSFYLDTPPGATITLVFIALFLVINLIKRIVILVQRKQRLK